MPPSTAELIVAQAAAYLPLHEQLACVAPVSRAVRFLVAESVASAADGVVVRPSTLRALAEDSSFFSRRPATHSGGAAAVSPSPTAEGRMAHGSEGVPQTPCSTEQLQLAAPALARCVRAATAYRLSAEGSFPVARLVLSFVPQLVRTGLRALLPASLPDLLVLHLDGVDGFADEDMGPLGARLPSLVDFRLYCNYTVSGAGVGKFVRRCANARQDALRRNLPGAAEPGARLSSRAVTLARRPGLLQREFLTASGRSVLVGAQTGVFNYQCVVDGTATEVPQHLVDARCGSAFDCECVAGATAAASLPSRSASSSAYPPSSNAVRNDDNARILVALPPTCLSACSLRVLSLAGSHRIDDRAMDAVARHCSELAVLDLTRLKLLTDGGLRALTPVLAKLFVLRLFACQQRDLQDFAPLASLGCNLRELDLCGCMIRDEQLRAIFVGPTAADHGKLRTLDLSFCVELTGAPLAELAPAVPAVTTVSLFGIKRCGDAAQAFAGHRSLVAFDVRGTYCDQPKLAAQMPWVGEWNVHS